MDDFDKKLNEELKQADEFTLSQEQLKHLHAEVSKNKNRSKVKKRTLLFSSLSMVCVAVVVIFSVFIFIGKDDKRYSNSDDCITSFITQEEAKNFVGDDLLPIEILETLTFEQCKLFKSESKNMALEFIYKEAESSTPVVTEITFLIELDAGFNYAKDEIYTLNSSEYVVNGVKVAQRNLTDDNNLFEKYRKFSYKDHKYYLYSIGLNELLIDDLIEETTK